MTVRIIKPSRIAPEIPLNVALFLEAEQGRHELALEGKTPDSDAIITSLTDELDALYDEGRATEEGEHSAYLTNTAWMIMRGMRDYILTDTSDVPSSKEEHRQHALTGMTYAALIRSGIAVYQWSESWRNSRYGGIAWPSDTHALCGSIGHQIITTVGSEGMALEFADDIQADSTAALSTGLPAAGMISTETL